MYRSLCDHMADPMSDQHFHGYLRVSLLPISQINDRPSDPICDLIWMRRIYLFYHAIPFLLRRSLSLTSSCGVLPVNSAEQFSFTIWKIWYQIWLTCFMNCWLIAT